MDLFRQSARIRAELSLLTDGVLVLVCETNSLKALALWRKFADARDQVARLTDALGEVLAELSR